MQTMVENLDDSQLAEVHALMKNEWWCADRTLEEVASVVAGSDLVLACLDNDGTVTAFLRVLTDRVFKAVLFDVIVRSDHRDSGLGRKLMELTIDHPMLKSVRSIELYCPENISGFYKSLGFDVSDSKLHRLVRG